MNGPPVINNERESRYEMQTDGGLAVLDYRLDGSRLALVHTEVPKSQQQRGLGAALVLAALEDARARGLRVAPLCAFVRGYIAKHPEYAPLVRKR